MFVGNGGASDARGIRLLDGASLARVLVGNGGASDARGMRATVDDGGTVAERNGGGGGTDAARGFARGGMAGRGFARGGSDARSSDGARSSTRGGGTVAGRGGGSVPFAATRGVANAGIDSAGSGGRFAVDSIDADALVRGDGVMIAGKLRRGGARTGLEPMRPSGRASRARRTSVIDCG